jgi:ABC-type Fe3+ transport system permease subunit
MVFSVGPDQDFSCTGDPEKDELLWKAVTISSTCHWLLFIATLPVVSILLHCATQSGNLKYLDPMGLLPPTWHIIGATLGLSVIYFAIPTCLTFESADWEGSSNILSSQHTD